MRQTPEEEKKRGKKRALCAKNPSARQEWKDNHKVQNSTKQQVWDAESNRWIQSSSTSSR